MNVITRSEEHCRVFSTTEQRGLWPSRRYVQSGSRLLLPSAPAPAATCSAKQNRSGEPVTCILQPPDNTQRLHNSEQRPPPPPAGRPVSRLRSPSPRAPTPGRQVTCLPEVESGGMHWRPEDTPLWTGDQRDTPFAPETEETRPSAPETDETRLPGPETEETHLSGPETKKTCLSALDTEETHLSTPEAKETCPSAPETEETRLPDRADGDEGRSGTRRTSGRRRSARGGRGSDRAGSVLPPAVQRCSAVLAEGSLCVP